MEEESQSRIFPVQVINPPDSNIVRYRLSNEDLLNEIEHKLKGEVWIFDPRSAEGGRWEARYSRMVNDLGLADILAIVSAYTHKGMKLANFTRDEINAKCYSLKIKISMLLMINYEKYQIDKEKRDIIVDIVVDSVHACLSRAEAGLEAKQISTITERREIVQQLPEEMMKERRGGFFRRFLPFGRRGG